MNQVLFDSWFSLTIAIIFGVLGTISMKLSHGLTNLKYSILLCVFYTISFSALTFAIKHIDLSIVYAVWSGLGTLLVSIIGVLWFNEKLSFKKIIFLFFIIIGVIGIHLGDILTFT